MQDIMFATVLYVAIICFVCCLRYQPSSATTVTTNTTDLPTEEPQPVNINSVLTNEPEKKPEAANALIETQINFQLPVAQSVKEASEALDSQPTSVSTGHRSHLTVPDPSKLTLRQCRAVIREINKGLAKQDRIRQKINGKDAPADWLRGQIARYLEAYPTVAMAMEEVVKAC
ncbi:MAG: hypothetical protein LDL41_23635 [Coleofasciculus sp. S288]|nr:hypothetical protein [Coleofasciculus sp. S288]